MWALRPAQKPGSTTTARAALASAAAAARYDDYFGMLTSVLYESAGILPIQESVLRASNQPGVSASGFKLTYAAGIAIALPHPYLDAVDTACKNSVDDSGLAQDCVAVAQKLADSGSLFARSAGARQIMEIVPSGTVHDAAVAQARTLAWRMQGIGSVADRLANDSRVTGLYTQALHASGREIDAVDAVLRSQRIALEPPADWQPPAPNATPEP
jgi:hypothetical protein